MVDKAKPAALAGAALLALGAFAPLISLPMLGSISYLQLTSAAVGVLVMLLAASTVALAANGRTGLVLWTGLASLTIVMISLLKVHGKITASHNLLERLPGDERLPRLLGTVSESIHLKWGWVPLLGGALVICWAGWISRNARA